GFSIRHQHLSITVDKIIRRALTYHSVHFIRTIAFDDEITGRRIVVLKLWHHLIINRSIWRNVVRPVRMVNGLSHARVSVDKFIPKLRISLIKRAKGDG